MSVATILENAAQRLVTLPNVPPVAWPGVDFTPPASGVWLELAIFPNEPQTVTMNADGLQVERGFVQVLAVTRPGAGIVSATMLAERVSDHFAKALQLGPVRVRAIPWIGPPVVEPDRILVPVTISYRT